MDQAEMNRLIQNAVEHVQAELQQKHEERIKALEAEHMVTVLINDPASVPALACDVTYLVEGHLMDARARGSRERNLLALPTLDMYPPLYTSSVKSTTV